MIPIAKGLYADWITPDGLLRIEGWARDGLTDAQIAKNIGINVATLYKWQNQHSEISNALKKGKAPVDLEVENALLKSALGYTVTVKKPVKVKVEKMKPGVGRVMEEVIQMTEEEVHIPPNTTAQIYWLNNRRPDRWRAKPENKISESEGVKVIIDV